MGSEMCIRDSILRAPAAPAPSVTKKMFVIDLIKLISPGAVNKPTAQVNITNDITLGFINLNNSIKIDVSSNEGFFALKLIVVI